MTSNRVNLAAARLFISMLVLIESRSRARRMREQANRARKIQMVVTTLAIVAVMFSVSAILVGALR